MLRWLRYGDIAPWTTFTINELFFYYVITKECYGLCNKYVSVSGTKMGFSLHELLFVWLGVICTPQNALCRQTAETIFISTFAFNWVQSYKQWIAANQPVQKSSSTYTGNHHAKSIFSSIYSSISLGLLTPVPSKYLKCTLELHITFLATPLPLPSLSHQRQRLPLILLGICVAPFFPKPRLSCSKLLPTIRAASALAHGRAKAEAQLLVRPSQPTETNFCYTASKNIASLHFNHRPWISR